MILRLLTLATTSGPGLLLGQPIRPAMKRLRIVAQRKRACAGERNFTFAENLQLGSGAERNRSVYQVSEISADQRWPVSPRTLRLSRLAVRAPPLNLLPAWLRP